MTDHDGTETAVPAPRSREEEVAERFDHEAERHRMTVALDQGVYRHLRFARPGGWEYHYSLVTWPGHLAITGDCGSYTFARVHDMFEFFRPDKYAESQPRWWINPDYWAQKLTNRDAAGGSRKYDDELFRPRVMEWLADAPDAYDLDAEGMTKLRAEVEDQLFAWREAPYSRDEAVTRLMDFRCTIDGRTIDIYEPHDWSLRDWDWQYLWCCRAIVQGIAQYDWSKGWR